MATTKPRLQITLSPDARAAVDRVAKLEARPASKVVTDILEEAIPVLDQIADTLQAIKDASESVRGKIATRLGQAERRAYAAAVEGMSVLAELEHDARHLAGSPPRVGAKRAPGEAGSRHPRPSNTGVTPPSLGKKRRK